MKKMFVDTWAWYALADAADHDHAIAETANAQWLDEGGLFVTTNYVLSESVTLIRYRLHHAAAVQYWRLIQQFIESELVELVRVSEIHEQTAWNMFEQYADQDFSWTDCTSFAIMRAYGLSHAFTADRHFATMGFVCFPESLFSGTASKRKS